MYVILSDTYFLYIINGAGLAYLFLVKSIVCYVDTFLYLHAICSTEQFYDITIIISLCRK